MLLTAGKRCARCEARWRSAVRWTVVPMLIVILLHAASAESAGSSYRKGKAAEEAGDVLGAFEAYKQAYQLKPRDLRYRATYERMRVAAAAEYAKDGQRLTDAKSLPTALAAFLKALDIDPGNEVAQASALKLEKELKQKDGAAVGEAAPSPPAAEPPVKLAVASGELVTLHVVEDSRIVYESIGKLAGLNVLFDPEYASKRIQVDLQNVTAVDALRVVGEVSGTFWKPVTHNTIFVAQDTATKRRTLSRQAVQIFYLRNVSEQNDFTDVQTALRNLFQSSAKLYGMASERAIMMRGTPDELQLAAMLIDAIDRPKPEVMVDITVMEVSRDKLRQIGISPPTSLTVTSGSSQTLNEIGRSSSYSISVGEAAVDFLLTDSDTRILQNPRLRALDGQKATLKLGERIPVATGSYTVPTSSTAAAAETQFTYLDVGVNVEMTPTIHANRDVTLKLSVGVSSQSGTDTISGVAEPVISQETAEEVIRVKDGESSILAGLVKRQENRNVSGWPGFGEIPLLKFLFTTQSHEVINDELVFLIVPHVVRAPMVETSLTPPIDTGTERAIELRGVPQL
jgi:general secretion pathway protein D